MSFYLDGTLDLARAEDKYYEEESKGHGRHEVRRCWVMDDVEPWLEGAGKWRELRSVAAIECERTCNGVTSVQRRYFITSLKADAKHVAQSVRDHWDIENSLHWVLDVTFGEDTSRARTGCCTSNLAGLRRLAASAIKREKPNSKKSINIRRFEADLDPVYLARLLGVTLDA